MPAQAACLVPHPRIPPARFCRPLSGIADGPGVQHCQSREEGPDHRAESDRAVRSQGSGALSQRQGAGSGHVNRARWRAGYRCTQDGREVGGHKGEEGARAAGSERADDLGRPAVCPNPLFACSAKLTPGLTAGGCWRSRPKTRAWFSDMMLCNDGCIDADPRLLAHPHDLVHLPQSRSELEHHLVFHIRHRKPVHQPPQYSQTSRVQATHRSHLSSRSTSPPTTLRHTPSSPTSALTTPPGNTTTPHFSAKIFATSSLPSRFPLLIVR